jgi:hypothetical protein
MIRISVTMDNDLLYQVINRLSSISAEKPMPAVAAAMDKGARIIRNTWKGYAAGRSLPGVEKLKKPQGGYMRSIYIDKHSPFDYEIKSDSPIAGYLEHGTDELDMKKTHPYGPRSRVSKEGVPYLIVPFRWGTPKTIGFRNVMPQSIYNIVKQKNFSKTFVTKKTHIELNARGEDVERREYVWGDRLTTDDDTVMLGLVDPEENKRMNGMTRMFGDDGKTAGYFTFRVISANSPKGWIKPAMPPRPIRSAVINATQKDVAELFESAARRDLGL